ncbi:MAG: GNAT family N-acetyltransferase [Reyranella sp.]|nr:GNAT family N-acetyltransferase [Reyranella sp.]
MSVGFVLHPLRAVDLDRAARLHREAFEPMGEPGWTRQDIAGLLASPGVAGFLVTETTFDIGMAICRVVADEAELLTLAVDPGHRRRGAARLLLDAVVEKTRSGGAESLFLEVGADNPGARALYDSLGFAVVGRRAGYYVRQGRPNADAFVLRLNLN